MLVMLDRDGVINEDRADSVKSIDELVLIEGAAQAIAKLNHAQAKVAIITNQSVVGRGTITSQQLDTIHDHLRALLAQHGAHVDAIYVCADHPDAASNRRKPAAGMLHEALQHFSADPSQSPMVGDALRDLQAAHAAGCPRYLVKTGKGAALLQEGVPQSLNPVVLCDDLAAAVDVILEARS